jgi:hypothetical protein
MYTHIYENSFVILILTFVILCVIFYLFKIGYSIKIENGKIVKKFGWRYPLAIALIVWLIWYFVLFPPTDVKKQCDMTKIVMSDTVNIPHFNGPMSQKINMANWT